MLLEVSGGVLGDFIGASKGCTVGGRHDFTLQ